MKWKLPSGREVNHRDGRYKIDWDKKAPSKGAQEVKDFLKKNCFNYIWFEEYRLPGGLLRVDYLSPNRRMVIEFHGRQHSTFVKHFHGSRSGFLSSIKRDVLKSDFLTLNDYKLVEIYDEDLPVTREFFEEKYNIYL